jgi:hypothetical protein
MALVAAELAHIPRDGERPMEMGEDVETLPDGGAVQAEQRVVPAWIVRQEGSRKLR